MPVEIVMPRLGWDMKVGSLAEWLKRDGDQVTSGEVVALITGDKATTELEAADSGTLRIPVGSPEPGVEVAVGTVLAYLMAPGESIAEPARVVATPRARRAARAHGVEWRSLRGSGRGGRVLERDVLQAATAPPSAADGKAAPAAAIPLQAAAVPLAGIRRVTAERLAHSAQQVVPVTLVTEADATPLVDLRKQAAVEGGTAPSVTDLLMKIVAVALQEHPKLNASLMEEGIVEHQHVHIGLAVDTPAGLLMPVVHDVQRRTVADISIEAARLIEAARNGRSRPEDLQGATFTITNLGMYDIDAFTPVVSLPQTAVLGVGRVVARPVVVDEATAQVGVRRMLTLSLTFDHRLVDGAPAARFLQTIKQLVERPTRWLFR